MDIIYNNSTELRNPKKTINVIKIFIITFIA